MTEKQRIHLREGGEPVRILLPIRLHEILVTNPTRDIATFSVVDGSPQVPTSLGMPFVVPPIKSEAIPFHGAQYRHGVQLKMTKGEADFLLVFEPNMDDLQHVDQTWVRSDEIGPLKSTRPDVG